MRRTIRNTGKSLAVFFDYGVSFLHSKKQGFVKLSLFVAIIGMIVYQVWPQGVKAGYSFQANYDGGSLNADYSVGTGTAYTDTALPALVSGYGGTNSLSFSADGTSTLRYPTLNNLPTQKGSIELKFQKSSYGGGVSGDIGNFNAPQGVAYDPATEYYYIADSGNNRIVKTKYDGTGWQTLGHLGSTGLAFNTPVGITYDAASGFIFVADYGNKRIVKTKIDGTGWATYGSNGSGVGQFTKILGIAYDPATEFIYAVDMDNYRIVKTKIDGTGWTTLGTNGAGTGNFKWPSRVSLDQATGYLYVVDQGNNRIVKTLIDGSGWTAYGTYGTGTGNFKVPNGIYYDPNSDYVYVADGGNNRLVKTKMDGTGWTSTARNATTDIYFNYATGYATVLDITNSMLFKVQIDGTNSSTFGGSARLSGFTALASYYDAQSGYYYGYTAKSIFKMKLDGTGFSTYAPTLAQGGFAGAGTISYDSASGYLFIADKENFRIVRTKMDGTGWASLSTAQRTASITYDPSSDTNHDGKGYAYVYSPSAILKVRYDGSSWTTSSYGGSGSGVGQFYLTNGHDNNAMYFDSVNGDIYVSDMGNNRIVKTKLDGSWTGWTTYGSSGSGVGQFSLSTYLNPQGISFDAATGYVYILDTGNARVVKTKIDGTGWTTLARPAGTINGMTADPATDYIHLSTGATLWKSKMDGTGQLTSTNYNGAEKILFSSKTTDDVRLVFDVTTRQLRFYLAYSTKTPFIETPPLNLTDAQWYTTRATYNKAARTVSISVDGATLATSTYDTDWGDLVLGDYFYVGSKYNSTTDRWDGMIDDINIDTQSVDVVAPTNPTAVNTHFYASASKATEYSTGNWGSDGDPYITWSGASDADSGLKGYWLYLGTSAIGNPISNSGVLATASVPLFQAHVGAAGAEQNIQVPASALTNGATYYLRIITQDNDLNMAAVQTNFTYKVDTTNPSTNPTTITSYSDSGKGTAITTDTWYNYTHPYFEWPAPETAGGAADTGSGIAGYYVYFGTSVNGNPVTEGTYTTNPNYTASGTLVNGQTYFLRIRSADGAANMAASSDTLFTYRYTNDSPVTPTFFGYDTAAKANVLTSDSWYSYQAPYFEWIGASSTPGIAGYYVYFGSNASADPEVAGAWQVGTNYTVSLPMAAGTSYYLRVKAKDNANNISAAVQFIYKFDDQAPLNNPTSFNSYSSSAKTTPITTATWYSHAQPYFEWDGAIDNHSGVAGYWVYFGTDADAVPATVGTFQAGVNKTINQVMTTGSTYYLILQTQNNAGIKTAKFTYFSYQYDGQGPTLADTINVSPLGCSTSATFAMAWEAATDPVPGSGFKEYEYKIGSQGQISATPLLAYSGAPYQEGDNVFYLRARDNAGNVSPWQTAVFCSTGLAHLIDGPTVAAGPSSMTVSWVSSKQTTGFVRVYDGNTYVSEQGQNSYNASHSVVVTGLKSEKAYRYQLVWTDSNGNLGESNWYQTATSTAPAVKNLRAEIISPSHVILSWQTTYPATCTLEYAASGFGEPITVSGNNTDFTYDLNGLSGGTAYQYRIKATSEDGTEFIGQDIFNTPPSPIISGMQFQPITDQAQSGMKVSWITNVETTSSLFYGPKGETKKEVATTDKVKNHEVSLSGLSDSTSYEVQAYGTDQYGNIATGEINTFTTPLDTRAPSISNVTIETSNVGSGQQDKAQIAVSWTTDEPATSMVEYGEGLSGDQYSNKSTEDKAYATQHLVIISDLVPSLPYHLKVVSSDKANNIAQSDDSTAIPGEVQKSILQIILNALQNSFGWLGAIMGSR